MGIWEYGKAPGRPYNNPIREREFIQKVRKYKPSSLVPLIGHYGAEFDSKERYGESKSRQYAPWGLMEMARVSLIEGNEYRNDATDKDLWECGRAYAAITDPQLNGSDATSVGRFLLRMSNQLAFQQPVFNELARSAALFEQTTPKKSPQVLRSGWVYTLLGCELREYIAAAFLLRASALHNSGRFDHEWLEQPQMTEITEEVPARILTAAIKDNFTSDVSGLKLLQQDAEKRFGRPEIDYRRFSFNPLWNKPVVSGLEGHLIIPVPHLLIAKASPLGIYYSGVAKWGNKFAEDTGDLLEAYVGRQLELASPIAVLPEIEYDRGKGRQLSVDWFAVFNNCVLLVEVKSTRPTEPVRRADGQAGLDLVKRLSHSIEQINSTAAEIRSHAPEFAAVPADRPLIGLAVTMEPFHTVNFPYTMSFFPKCDIPFRFCSVLELEQFVTVSDTSPGELLHQFMTDPSNDHAMINGALAGHASVKNVVLDDGWATYPWMRELAESQQDAK